MGDILYFELSVCSVLYYTDNVVNMYSIHIRMHVVLHMYMYMRASGPVYLCSVHALVYE